MVWTDPGHGATDFTGMSLGRKFFSRGLIELSPNKTWEGFLGALVFTLIFAFSFTGFCARFHWLVCPADKLTLALHPTLTCDPHTVFRLQTWDLSSILGMDLSGLGPLSGPWELRPAQIHMCSFALFASLVAPFGGFLASGIKRAFGLKDFSSLIPGHGGFMDRMDCQMLMGLFTSVYLAVVIGPQPQVMLFYLRAWPQHASLLACPLYPPFSGLSLSGCL